MAEILFKVPDVIDENPHIKDELLDEVEKQIKRAVINIEQKEPIFGYLKQKYSTLKQVDICASCGTSAFVFDTREDVFSFLRSLLSKDYKESFSCSCMDEIGKYRVDLNGLTTLESIREVFE